jgi:hypothetical protein
MGSRGLGAVGASDRRVTDVQKSGRNVPEQSAADAAVAQRAPGEHQHDPNFHAAACVHVKPADCSIFTCLCLTTEDSDVANQLVRRAIRPRIEPHSPVRSWLAVDGYERVGVGQRITSDLVKSVTINQIWPT